MIKLYGFEVSNYYNMVKFALLEKGLEFEEVNAMPSQEDEFKSKSPMGKIPYIETEQGFLTETIAIMDYIEAFKPNPALVPADIYAAAKVREMMKVVELYIELPTRRHYGELFFGGDRDKTAEVEARPIIEKGLQAMKHLGSFSPFICGEFTNADIVAAHSFIYVAPVCQAVYGWDVMAEVPGLQDAIDATNSRDVGKKVMADHLVALKAFQEG
ncbi:MAG: glutathione S-transferase family protein [Gammaproteobacteria bacterium]